jgi:hypothetical protein
MLSDLPAFSLAGNEVATPLVGDMDDGKFALHRSVPCSNPQQLWPFTMPATVLTIEPMINLTPPQMVMMHLTLPT